MSGTKGKKHPPKRGCDFAAIIDVVPPLTSISAAVKQSARELGFDLAGIAPVQQFRELEYFPQWIAEQRHGEMRYLESRTESGELKRASIQKAAPWARSVIVCALNYNTDQPYSTEFTDKSKGWISRYAWGQRDYHDVILPKLRALEEKIEEEFADDGGEQGEKQIPRGLKSPQDDKGGKRGLVAAGLKARPSTEEDRVKAEEVRFWSYVDTGPIVERVLAQHAGIGWIGKNTCIINQQLGSWLFLGIILTSLELGADLPAPDRCGTCTRCLDSCPTNAFLDAYKLDASKCISYLTIEKRGDVPRDLRDPMQNHVFGCDICQDVCPWNNHPIRPVPFTKEARFQPRPDLVNPPLEKLATLSGDGFRQMFRGSPVKRTKRTGIRRNAVIAMGNSGDKHFLPLLTELEADPDETVAEHARWAKAKLKD